MEYDIFSEILESIEIVLEELFTFMSRWDAVLKASMQTVRNVVDIGFQLDYANRNLGKFEKIPEIRENLMAKLYMILYDEVVPSLDKSYKDFKRLVENNLNIIKDNLENIKELFISWKESDEDKTLFNKVSDFISLIIKSIEKIIAMYEKNFKTKTIIIEEVINGSPSVVELTNYFTIWRIEPDIRIDMLQKIRQELEENINYLKEISQEYKWNYLFFKDTLDSKTRNES
ncbi:MAG: hypothetical protein ACTSVF_03780 [Candidatus Asgardarchaeia archaeon]